MLWSAVKAAQFQWPPRRLFTANCQRLGDACHSKLATGINALRVRALSHLSSVSSWVSISVLVPCISTRREHWRIRGRSRSNGPLPAFCIVGDVYVLSHTVDNSMVQTFFFIEYSKYISVVLSLVFIYKTYANACFFSFIFQGRWITSWWQDQR